MKAWKIDHLGVAVASIGEALPVYEALGLAEARREDVPSQGVRTAFLPVGESSIELLEPLSADSPVGRFLKSRGPGLHHVCFRARTREDVDTAHRFLVEMGAVIVHPPEEGPWAPGYYSVLFEDPDGIRLEINHVPGRGLLEEKK